MCLTVLKQSLHRHSNCEEPIYFIKRQTTCNNVLQLLISFNVIFHLYLFQNKKTLLYTKRDLLFKLKYSISNHCLTNSLHLAGIFYTYYKLSKKIGADVYHWHFNTVLIDIVIKEKTTELLQF